SEDENAKKPANDYQAFFGAEAVINFIGARNCRVENCGFSDYGLYGIDIDNECRNIDITRCRFENSGGGGIKIRHIANKTDFDVADNINISDCLIKNIGLIHTSACGILITLAQNCRISHNEICYTGYSGISVGWEWGYKDGKTKNIIIEKNHIHHISQGQLSDLGGIYLLGIQKGSIIRGNLIHDVVHKTYGASGIYADEGTSLVTFENNICYNTEYAGFQLHFGYGNIIRNNIFESGSLGSFWLWRHDAATAAYLKHNILIAKDKNYIFGGQTVDVLSSNVERDYNLYFGYTKTKPVMYKHFKTEKDFDDLQKEQGSDKNSIVKDPMFADYENKNFSLTKASPAKEIGFFDIDMSDVGIRR
ncbi:MAG: right-handed parallel beta-helix repeat-containing protein, partial [Clostridiales bacterium]|nr:right-handed parallel beta-helix repeat-containing protein [Clostridiales bacterium]